MTGRWWGLLLGGTAAMSGVHLRLAGVGRAGDPATVLLHFGIAFFLYLCVLPAARHLSERRPALVLLVCFAGAALSMAAYLESGLLLSEEVHRYRWDGMVAEQGYNPYEVYPDDPELAGLRDRFDPGIPHAGTKGLYSPLAELFFFAMTRYGLDSLLHYRIVCSVLALVCGLAFLPLCRAASVPSTRVVVFLLHPLLILETAANAHVEVLGLCFLLLSLSLLIGGHQLSPLATLAFSTLVRPFAFALFPLYLRRIPVYRVILYFLVLVGGTLPFIGAGPELWAGIAEFMREGRFNPGFYLLAERGFEWVGRPEWTRTAIAGLGLGVAAGLYFTDDGTNPSILHRGFYLTLPPVLLGPVVNPWYLLWVLPFLALVDRRNPLRMAVLYLSGSVFLSYLDLAWGRIPAWLTWMEYGPVAVLALLGFWRRGRMESPV